MKLRLFALSLSVLSSLAALAQSSDSPYDQEYSLKEGMRRVVYQKKYGYLDEKRKEVVAPQYLKAEDFRKGLAEVSADGKRYGYINTRGSVVIPLEYDEFMYGFMDGYTPARKDGKWGMINEKNKTVIPFRYDYVYYFFDGLANVLVRENGQGKYGFVNEKGQEVIAPRYSNASIFNGGLAAVEENGKWGFINTRGQTVIPFSYDKAEGFQDGLAAVRIRGKWGFIDAKNNLVIPASFDEVYSFKNGEAEVRVGSDGYCIDRQGNRLPNGRWLMVFNKGTKGGEQYWFRNDKINTDIDKKYAEGFRFVASTQNLFKNEYFVIMSKGAYYDQTLHHTYDYEKMWKKIQEMSNAKRSISNISYGNGTWSFVSTAMAPNYAETVIHSMSYPSSSMEKYFQQGYFITSMAYGDDHWFVVMGKIAYRQQVIRDYEFEKWDEEDVKQMRKDGFMITSMVKVASTYKVVFTKGTVITDQLLVWSDEVPMREIRGYWDKGYRSFQNFYLPRSITIHKKLGW